MASGNEINITLKANAKDFTETLKQSTKCIDDLNESVTKSNPKIKALQDQISLLESMLKKLQNAQKNVDSGSEQWKKKQKDIEAIAEEIEKTTKQIEKLNEKQKSLDVSKLGIVYTEYMKLKQALEQLTKEQSYFEKGSGFWEEYQRRITKVKDKMGELDGTLNEFAKKEQHLLQNVDKYAKLITTLDEETAQYRNCALALDKAREALEKFNNAGRDEYEILTEQVANGMDEYSKKVEDITSKIRLAHAAQVLYDEESGGWQYYADKVANYQIELDKLLGTLEQIKAEHGGIDNEVDDVNESTEAYADTIKRLESETKKGQIEAITFSAKLNILEKVIGLVKNAIVKLIEKLDEYSKIAFESQEQSVKLAVAIQNTGNAIGKFTEKVTKLVNEMDENTLFSDKEIEQATAYMVSIQSLTDDMDLLQRAIEISADMATMMGDDLTSTAKAVSRALTDPTNATFAFQRAGVKLSAETVELCKNLMEEGRQGEAINAMLVELESRYGGLAQTVSNLDSSEMTKLKKNVQDIKEAIDGIVTSGLAGFLERINVVLETIKIIAEWVESKQNSNNLLKRTRNGELTASQIIDLYTKDEIMDAYEKSYSVKIQNESAQFFKNRPNATAEDLFGREWYRTMSEFVDQESELVQAVMLLNTTTAPDNSIASSLPTIEELNEYNNGRDNPYRYLYIDNYTNTFDHVEWQNNKQAREFEESQQAVIDAQNATAEELQSYADALKEYNNGRDNPYRNNYLDNYTIYDAKTYTDAEKQHIEWQNTTQAREFEESQQAVIDAQNATAEELQAYADALKEYNTGRKNPYRNLYADTYNLTDTKTYTEYEKQHATYQNNAQARNFETLLINRNANLAWLQKMLDVENESIVEGLRAKASENPSKTSPLTNFMMNTTNQNVGVYNGGFTMGVANQNAVANIPNLTGQEYPDFWNNVYATKEEQIRKKMEEFSEAKMAILKSEMEKEKEILEEIQDEYKKAMDEREDKINEYAGYLSNAMGSFYGTMKNGGTVLDAFQSAFNSLINAMIQKLINYLALEAMSALFGKAVGSVGSNFANRSNTLDIAQKASASSAISIPSQSSFSFKPSSIASSSASVVNNFNGDIIGNPSDLSNFLNNAQRTSSLLNL